jgi:hypothetical protein
MSLSTTALQHFQIWLYQHYRSSLTDILQTLQDYLEKNSTFQYILMASFSFIRHQLFFSDWAHFKNYILYVCQKLSKIYCNFSFPYDWYWFDGINNKTSLLNRVLSKVNKIWFYKKTMKSLSDKFYFKKKMPLKCIGRCYSFPNNLVKFEECQSRQSSVSMILIKLLYLNKIFKI